MPEMGQFSQQILISTKPVTDIISLFTIYNLSRYTVVKFIVNFGESDLLKVSLGLVVSL